MVKKSIVLIILLFALFAQVVSAQDEQTTYTVRNGDTLQSIATFFDTTIEALVAANNIANPTFITPGQKMIIVPADYVQNLPQRTYTVQRGDTLQAIADRNNTTVEAIQQYNVIANPSSIVAGEVINLPPVGGPTETVSTATVTQTTVVQQPAPIVRRVVNGRYTVQVGDTMFAIGRAFNVDIFNIARANGILNLNLIYVGQSLVIPGY